MTAVDRQTGASEKVKAVNPQTERRSITHLQRRWRSQSTFWAEWNSDARLHLQMHGDGGASVACPLKRFKHAAMLRRVEVPSAHVPEARLGAGLGCEGTPAHCTAPLKSRQPVTAFPHLRSSASPHH